MIVATVILLSLAAAPAVISLLPRALRPRLGLLNVTAVVQLALLAAAALCALQVDATTMSTSAQAALLISATASAGLGGSGVSTAVLDSASRYDAQWGLSRRPLAHAEDDAVEPNSDDPINDVAAVVSPRSPGDLDAEDRPVLRGGAWIGLLERLAVAATLLGSWPEGLAVVLAVKGLARYSELKRPNGAAERFIIGTFSSVLWASACAGVAVLGFTL